MTDLHGKCALITGASSGIGRATAIALAKLGVNLILVSRSLEKLAAVAEEAKTCGVNADIYSI
ncbi:MAG: SDR family NAD(P)-dependent oxidoreductase, partial [Coleofasciculaceae cyanobacterium RL_1_1]|nr:SDR family NAD(P)-dependent oxidoreductase [Coleofasciculaceae cyanobacterium RL_1_1]